MRKMVLRGVGDGFRRNEMQKSKSSFGIVTRHRRRAREISGERKRRRRGKRKMKNRNNMRSERISLLQANCGNFFYFFASPLHSLRRLGSDAAENQGNKESKNESKNCEQQMLGSDTNETNIITHMSPSYLPMVFADAVSLDIHSYSFISFLSLALVSSPAINEILARRLSFGSSFPRSALALAAGRERAPKIRFASAHNATVRKLLAELHNQTADKRHFVLCF